jgi:RimJ/RimL family protein N-acetyltransferase
MVMVREIRDEDAAAYVELRRRALLDSPLAFTASPADDFVGSADAVHRQLRQAPEWVIFGAFNPELIGSLGLFRDRHLKASHRVHLWGMYVDPDHRGHGVGAGLLNAAIAHARTLDGVSWALLSVSSAAPSALRLYERAGFRIWGTEPDALRHDGESVTERHMALQL